MLWTFIYSCWCSKDKAISACQTDNNSMQKLMHSNFHSLYLLYILLLNRLSLNLSYAIAAAKLNNWNFKFLVLLQQHWITLMVYWMNKWYSNSLENLQYIHNDWIYWYWFRFIEYSNSTYATLSSISILYILLTFFLINYLIVLF